MTELRMIKTAEIGGIGFEVREITVGEIRRWLAEERKLDAVDVLLIDGVVLDDLVCMTSATREQLEALTPTMVRALADAVQEVNVDFFAFRRRLSSLAVRASTDVLPASSSNGAAADS